MALINNLLGSNAVSIVGENKKASSKSLSKITSGVRIRSAADDSANYSISERMKSMLRALNQDIQNAQNGTSLIKVAEGGIQNIIDELREMKAMALDSANAHNSDSDRKTIQKVFSRHVEGIDDIAVSTNYNGIPLLDGRWWGYDGVGDFFSNETENSIDISNYTPVLQPTRPSSNTPPTIIPAGNYTITQDGVYQLDFNYTGKVTISAENVEIRQSNWPNLAGDVSFECTLDNTNLWLNRLNVNKTSPGSFIRFGAGTNNTLNLVGGNYLGRDINGMNGEASVNIGGGLTIFDGDGTGSFGVGGGYSLPQPLIMGAIIGSDANENSKSSITINGGDISLHLGNPTGIGSGANGSIGNIFINGGKIICSSEGGSYDPDNTRTGAAIGSGYMGTVEGSIVINGGTITAGSDCVTDNTGSLNTTSGATYASGAGIGAGANGVVKGKIIIRDGMVNAYAAYGAAIGTGATCDSGDTSVGRIFINGGEIHAKSEFGSAIGIGSTWEGYNPTVIRTPAGTVGSITVNGGTYSTAVNNNNNPPIRFYRSMYDRVLPDVTGEDESDFLPQTETEYIRDGNPLRIHIGPKANENIAIFINDMHSDAMGLSEVAVDPLEKALKAIDKLDEAIDYALNENTRMGAYQIRLSETIDTLETRFTNITAAQSTITDADMAKEMVAYVKNNILLQASQTMLAQSFQNIEGALSLLQ